jgi:Lon protease-like protein
MIRNPFTCRFADLPTSIAIFPLSNAVLMPGTQLPLNIFEPRYLSMVFDALRSHRMIGMVQPDPQSPDAAVTPVFRTGCAGRITTFKEIGDGRLEIVLSGICRFDIEQEISVDTAYRRVVPDWSRFAGDYNDIADKVLDRTRFIPELRSFCRERNIEVEWSQLDELRDQNLIDLLGIYLPLETEEKQALIETVGVRERADLLLGMLQMSAGPAAGSHAVKH